MFITDIFKQRNPVVSFEIFPPNKQSKINTIYNTIESLAMLQPDYMSVTYGATGVTDSKNLTLKLASFIKNELKIESLAHLTCIDSSKKQIHDKLLAIKEQGIDNVLALRGDLPLNYQNLQGDFNYASDLITEIKSNFKLSIGAACHPEGHIEAKSRVLDLINLKKKVDSGADFLISQLFFNNQEFYSFLKEVRLLNINIPVVAGIMPVVNTKQIQRITTLCGANVPEKFKKIMVKYQYNKQALIDAGIAYASEQIIDLLSSGVDGVHIYVMNRPEIAKRLISNISSVVKVLNTKERENAV